MSQLAATRPAHRRSGGSGSSHAWPFPGWLRAPGRARAHASGRVCRTPLPLAAGTTHARSLLAEVVPGVPARPLRTSEMVGVFPCAEGGPVMPHPKRALPPTRWPLARVTALHPGDDGMVRVVTLKTAASQLTRPLVKIVLLPTGREEATQNHE